MASCACWWSKTIRRLRRSWSKGLQEAGYALDAAEDGNRGLQLALAEPYVAAVLDLMLPGRDGLSVLEELRRRRVGIPVLILSARHSVDDRVRGLQAGGDDYLTRPFALSELLARLQAIIRRSQGVTGPSRLVSGDITIHPLGAPGSGSRLAADFRSLNPDT